MLKEQTIVLVARLISKPCQLHEARAITITLLPAEALLSSSMFADRRSVVYPLP
jgi:hypothetical protein